MSVLSIWVTISGSWGPLDTGLHVLSIWVNFISGSLGPRRLLRKKADCNFLANLFDPVSAPGPGVLARFERYFQLLQMQCKRFLMLF